MKLKALTCFPCCSAPFVKSTNGRLDSSDIWINSLQLNLLRHFCSRFFTFSSALGRFIRCFCFLFDRNASVKIAIACQNDCISRCSHCGCHRIQRWNSKQIAIEKNKRNESNRKLRTISSALWLLRQTRRLNWVAECDRWHSNWTSNSRWKIDVEMQTTNDGWVVRLTHFT